LVKDPAFNRIESIIIDQIIKGDGYPIMLAEAHEKAVIKTRDRLVFCRLLEQYGCQSLGISRKLHKKQRPCV
jgi:NurA-like 5'-3' nuclease